MTTTHKFFKALQKLTLALAIFSVLAQCSEEELLPVATVKTITAADTLNNYADSTGHVPAVANCSECTFVVPADQRIIDGKELGLKPGSVIGLNSAIAYGTLEFYNIVGTEDNPIIIKNCGGTVNIKSTYKWHAVKTFKSKYFRITGGSTPGIYGIRIQGGVMGLNLDDLSTNFEVDHVEISNVEFAGLMAKTDPSCNDATIRGNFTMYDVSLHDNYIHETGGEGFYVGNSFYDGMKRDCGKRLPHEIKGLKIFNNIIRNSGWEAIQVGCAIEGSEIYNNSIENYGLVDREYQNNGIQVGSGTGGLVYNNFIKKGTGNGMIIMGTGDNVIYNNIIVEAGSNGIFCDERFTPGEGFKFINNTIISPKKDGIRLYAELVPLNTVINNIISNPGSYESYASSQNPEDAFVYLVNSDVNIEMSNNLFVHTLDTIQFVNPAEDNYRLKSNSPAVNYGKDISAFKISHDFYNARRLKGLAYDIGASEY
jgi:hypothetical protein